MKSRPWHDPRENRSSHYACGTHAVVLRRSGERIFVQLSHAVFRKQWNGIERNIERVFDSIDDSRRRTVHGKFADALRTIRPVYVSQLFEEHSNRGQVARSRHDVVGHLAVLHASILPNHFFTEAESDRLGNTADDLALRQNWMQNLTNFLEGHEVVHRYAIRRQINRDLRDVNRPSKRRVGFSSIFLIVPENIAGRLVARP